MQWFRRQRTLIQASIGCGFLLMVCTTLTIMTSIVLAITDGSEEDVAAQAQGIVTMTATGSSRAEAAVTPAKRIVATATATATPTETPVPLTATPVPTETPVPPTATTEPTATYVPTRTPTPPPTATPLPYTLPREYAEFFDGFSVTVTEWYTLMNTAGEPYSIREGMRFVYINTMSCAGAVQVSINPGDFQLEMPDNRRANFTVVLGMSEDGRLRPSTIAPGDCVQGRIYFEITMDSDPLHVLYTGLLRGQTKFLAVNGDE